jgi:2-methylcitrate dehydratase PrpD
MDQTRFARGEGSASIAGLLGAWLSTLEPRELPKDVIDKAKACFVDFLSGALTIGTAERAPFALAAVGAGRHDGSATVIGSRYRLAPADSAFVNTTSAASTSRSDTHAATAIHPGMTVIPAVLAISEERGASGLRLLGGIVVAYEIMCRLAEALVTPAVSARFRPTGITGAAGAAAGAAFALGLDSARARDAIAIAAQLLSGLNEWAQAGTTDHVHHSAFASRNAVTAALLAEGGASGPERIFEGRSGLLAAFDAASRADALTHGLGDHFSILDISHKSAPACMYAQTPVQVAQALVRANRVDPTRIDRVEISTCQMGIEYPGCAATGPIREYQAAKQSIPFSVASVLTHGGVHDSNWTNFTDPAVNALSRRCALIAGEAFTRDFPARNGASVRVITASGDVLFAEQADLRNLTFAEIADRFRSVAEPTIGPTAAAEVLEMVEALEDVRDLGRMTARLRTSWGLNSRA